MQGIMCKENDNRFFESFYRKLIILEHRSIHQYRKGDPDHTPDPTWQPLLQTPDSPTYPSVSGCYAGLTSYVLTK